MAYIGLSLTLAYLFCCCLMVWEKIHRGLVFYFAYFPFSLRLQQKTSEQKHEMVKGQTYEHFDGCRHGQDGLFTWKYFIYDNTSGVVVMVAIVTY